MANSGWTTSPTPGPLAQQIAQQAGQQQQAQASASAAAATQQQVSGLQSSLQADVSTLAQDAASLDNDNSLATDVQGMKNDVAAEQKDYATVQADDCAGRPGDAGTVDGARHRGRRPGHDPGDISSLQSNSVSSDITKVQGDVSQLKSLGATPATDPTAALAAGHKALKDMASAIAWAQQQSSALDGQAHQIAKAADALANGCLEAMTAEDQAAEIGSGNVARLMEAESARVARRPRRPGAGARKPALPARGRGYAMKALGENIRCRLSASAAGQEGALGHREGHRLNTRTQLGHRARVARQLGERMVAEHGTAGKITPRLHGRSRRSWYSRCWRSW